MNIFQFIKAAFFKSLPKLNIWKTIYFNFKVLPFKQALHLPIHLYGKWNFRMLQGRVIIPASQVKFGRYQWGFDIAGYFTSLYNTLSMHQNSTIELGIGARFGQGVQICLYPDAQLKMNNYSSLGDNVKIIDYQSIKIGERTDITWDCQLSDFSSHYMFDTKTNTIATICKPIEIGDYCWICNRTMVMPGTILPNRVIVASNSLLNKDYRNLGIQERSLIGGSPAKLIKTEIFRIYNRENENWLKQYFVENPEIINFYVNQIAKFEE